jgi:hypothetical protein
VFASAPRDLKLSQCPNEFDFYSHSTNSNKDLCTSLLTVRKNVLDSSVVDEAAITRGKQSAAVKVDIPFSAKTNLGQLAKLNLNNVEEHHKSYVCLFTNTRQVVVNAFSKKKETRFTKSNLIW